MRPGYTSVAALRTRFENDAEFALLDVREVAEFARGHLLAASNLPLSRIELLAPAALPRPDTEIVLCDVQSEAQARRRLTLLGYDNVLILEGGLGAWALEGGKLFSGVNVIGKAFGEYVEKHRGTPAMSAAELETLLGDEHPPLLLDTRTPEEHREFCIPGALSCPNGELVWRALAAIDSPQRLVVTHCAGRTRSIIGAQTLIDAGVGNRVVALENGTLAWEFERLALERGADRPLPAPQGRAAEAARAAARRLGERFGVQRIDLETLERWRSSADRTLYLIDVRSAGEYQRGTLPEARHVPGGQLVQNVDEHIVTRNARVVLLDADGVRATTSAAWLTQMGYRNVCTLTAEPHELDDDHDDTATGVELPRVDAGALATLLASGAAVAADIRSSVDFRRNHARGAWYLNRADIEQAEARLPPGDVVLIGDDARYAALCAADLERLGRRVRLLSGGFTTWREAGLPTARGVEQLASEPRDVAPFGEDFDDPGVAAREGRAYLEWEIGLVHQLDNDPGAPYAAEPWKP